MVHIGPSATNADIKVIHLKALAICTVPQAKDIENNSLFKRQLFGK